ncbi:hypothetical protein QCA50_008620 [Cerrena zonata]|uniref:PHD-type domain-containing protein n=1 Tax=Cerrena zonata TaxID=2478898 RepID=A0AAW0GAT0_9APHY
MSASQHAKPEFEQGSTKRVSSTYDRSALAMAAERVAARQHLPTPNSSPASRGGGPASNSKFTSHLPTPQSPGNKDAYTSLAFDQGTPTRNKSQRPLPELNPYEYDLPPSPSFLTPESSPLFPRKGRLSRPFRTPSPKTTSGSSQHDGHETTSVSNGSHRSITPPPMSRDISPAPSGLSSPFMDKRSNGHSPSRPSTPKRPRLSSPGEDLMVIDDGPMPGIVTAKPSPSLQAPIPQRPVGGEIHRIRLQLAVDQAARQDEAEARRPEYLKRLKRSSPDSEYNFFNDPPEKEVETTTLGIADSPVKGRRIALFQATSEESFEQSLFTGGFRRYGATPAYIAEPQTPQKPSKPQLSQQAINWLHHPTPGKSAPPVVEEQPEDWVPSEREITKRRRLAAFEGSHRRNSSHKLFAIEIDGKGKVLVDQSLTLPETPPKPKPGRKRKGRAATPAKKGVERPPQEPEPMKPNWLDGEFPWAVRNQERSHLTQMEHSERMKVIEHFLDRSSSDEEDDEDQSLKPSLRSDVTAVDPPFKRGRGKMVPLKANPEPRSETFNKKFLIPSDPADARVALLSKRSVRSLAFRKRLQRARENDDSDEEAVCACGGPDDGRELVQCDECRTWYHLQCIGIRDISELGKEEDPWYCPDCLGVATPTNDPTFVPNDPSFFQSSSKMSLNVPWGSIAAPNTPMNRGRGLPEAFSTRSIWETTPQAGPSTPRTQFTRLQQTPNTLGLGVGVNESPFDPTSTPSRGMQFGGPFTTPKTTAWSSRNNLLRTPTQSSKPLPSSFNFTFGSTSNKSPPRTVYTYEETPIQRSKPRAEKMRSAQRFSSPPSSRAPMYPLGLQDSPLGGKKVRGRKNPSLVRQTTPSPL